MKGGPARQVRDGRSGQAVVEFALVLPIFLLLLFAAVEFGRAYFSLHLLTNAAREGARAGSLVGRLEDDVTATVDQLMQDVGFADGWTTAVTVKDPDGVERSGGLVEAVEGDRIGVTVTYNFTVLVGSIIPGFTGTVPLRAHCAFRHE